MGKLTVTTFLSLDGVMQGPGGPDEDRSGGFDRGGWLVPYADEDMGAAVAGWFAEAGGFLLGRKTYEIFAAYWPKVTDENDPVASRLNSLPKYVVSTTLHHPDWNGTTVINRDVASQIVKLKDEVDGELQVHGSGELIRFLVEHDLVDELRLLTYPVVVARGRRLFVDGGTPVAMQLVDTQATRAGVTITTYRPAGAPQFGSFAMDQ